MRVVGRLVSRFGFLSLRSGLSAQPVHTIAHAHSVSIVHSFAVQVLFSLDLHDTISLQRARSSQYQFPPHFPFPNSEHTHSYSFGPNPLSGPEVAAVDPMIGANSFARMSCNCAFVKPGKPPSLLATDAINPADCAGLKPLPERPGNCRRSMSS